MGATQDRINELKEKESKILQMGGEKPLQSIRKMASLRQDNGLIIFLMKAHFVS